MIAIDNKLISDEVLEEQFVCDLTSCKGGCCEDGVAGAPKFRDDTDWKPRLLKQNIDSLTATALKGMNAMPVKGTCQECSDADIKAAIQYMVPQL